MTRTTPSDTERSTPARARQGQTTALLGLVAAAVAVLAILPVRRGTDAGFALIFAPILLISAGAVWRFGRPALLWAAFLGFLLVLMFGAYAIAGIADGGAVGVLAIDLAVVVGGVVTLWGSLRALLRPRSSAGRP